jgi:hypothetical protein
MQSLCVAKVSTITFIKYAHRFIITIDHDRILGRHIVEVVKEARKTALQLSIYTCYHGRVLIILCMTTFGLNNKQKTVDLCGIPIIFLS